MDKTSTEFVRTRLRRHRGHYPEVSRRAGLGYSWVMKFANGDRGKRPSFDSIQRLTRTLDVMDAEAAVTRDVK